MEYILPPLPSWRATFGISLAFFGLTLAIYGPSLTNDFVRWDDGMLIYENPAIREITPRSIKHIFTTYDPELYIPLTFFTYQIDFQLGGTNAFPYHLGNLILHTLNALLVAWVVFLLSRRSWMALVCGLLFAVHPLHTEAVEWASARKDVLSGFFFLSAIIAYLSYRDFGNRRVYWISILCFLLGLLSKVMVITLPVILILLDMRERRKWWKREALIEKVPYLILALVFGLIALGGKQEVVASSSLTDKILMAPKSAVFYLEKIFVPLKLSLLYPYTKDIALASPDFFLPILTSILLAGLAALSLRWTRELFFGLAFFAVTVAPTFLNFAKGGDTDVYFASDRYAYLPSIGILFLAILAVAWLFDHQLPKALRRHAASLAGGLSLVIVGLLATLAYRQTFVWKDTEALFLNVLKHYPESSYVAHNNLGNVYRLEGDVEKSIESYKKSIAIRPHARSYSNLGAAYRRKKMYREAHEAYAKALELSPTSEIPYYGLGIVYAEEGEFEKAKAAYEKAVALKPKYVEAYVNLATLLVNAGRHDEAIAHYHTALRLNSYFPDAHYNLGIALTEVERYEEAMEEYREALRLHPAFTEARLNLALMLITFGELDEAKKELLLVTRYDPKNTLAPSMLQKIEGQGAAAPRL